MFPLERSGGDRKILRLGQVTGNPPTRGVLVWVSPLVFLGQVVGFSFVDKIVWGWLDLAVSHWGDDPPSKEGGVLSSLTWVA